MKRLTLRGRVLLASVGVLALALIGVSVGFNLLLDHQLSSDASTVLHNRAAAHRATIEIRRGRVRVEELPNDAALDAQAWVFDGTRLIEHPAATRPSVLAAVRKLAGVTQPTERSVGDVRLLAAPLHAADRTRVGTQIVGVSLVPYRHTRRIALIGSLALSALVLVIALLAVRFAIRSALRPVAEMTASAADWGEHDLHRRFDLGAPRDELTALAATFDGLLRRIEAVVRHEQRFSAEIAHELRTPLTGVRGEAELELGRTDLDPDSRAAFEHIVEASRRMETVIETLLSAARATDGVPAGSCDPLPAVREALAMVAPAADARAIEIRLSGPERPVTVDAAPEMVAQALYPLLENGVRHAASRVEVTLAPASDAVAFAVADDGPGLPDGDVFEPGVSSTGGAGLGLPLARRLARSCGGDVAAAPSGRGARLELRLPGGPATQ